MIKRQAINIWLISTIDKYKPRTNSRDKETMTLHILLTHDNIDDTWLLDISQPLEMAMLILFKPHKPYYSQ